jgi:methionyl-tRNA formyltransferase
MNILFWSSSSLSIPFLKLLKEIKEINIVSVITTPDKPQGRGLKIKPSEVRRYAEENKIPIFAPQNLQENEFIDSLKILNPDLSIVMSYGKIISKKIIEIHKIGMLNIHFSLLPKYRGAAPIQWCLINGEKNTGVTIFWINEVLDTGEIFVQKEVGVSLYDNYYTLSEKLVSVGCELLKDTVFKILSGKIIKFPQVGEPSYAPLIKKELGKIDWSKTAFEIHNLIRALVYWPKAYTSVKIDNKLINLKIIESYLVENKFLCDTSTVGEVVRLDESGIVVLCGGKSFLKILKLQPENRKILSAKEFICGYRIKKNDRFL